MTISVTIKNDNRDGPLSIGISDEQIDAEGKAVFGSNHVVSPASEVTLTLHDGNRLTLTEIKAVAQETETPAPSIGANQGCD